MYLLKASDANKVLELLSMSKRVYPGDEVGDLLGEILLEMAYQIRDLRWPNS